jgi:hypothetical protein
MSKRGEELLIASLSDRWSATHNPSIGVTCRGKREFPIHVERFGNKYRHNLTSLSYSLKGEAAGGCDDLSVRDGSIGGTVRAQWDFIVAIAGSAQGTLRKSGHSRAYNAYGPLR